jgi:propanol-preferring alcohol dehydrogenase
MKAATLHRFGAPLKLSEWPDPEVHGEETLVRVLGAGVCHTDLHIIDGRFPTLPLPRVLGHEIAGHAEGIGEVLVYASWGCRTCALCQRGEEQLCPRATEPGWVRDGGYAEYVVVPSRRYLLPLGDLDPVRAAPLADAGLTPYRAVRRIRQWLLPGSTAIVIGAGGLGQFAVQYLKLLTEARVIAVDPSEPKRRRAEELGANETASPGDQLPPARVVLDFVGSDETLRLAAGVVERTGILVQIGEGIGCLPFGFGLVPHEVHITNSVWGSLTELASVLEHANRGEVNWHVDTLGLDQANEALDRLRRGEVAGRLVLVP